MKRILTILMVAWPLLAGAQENVYVETQPGSVIFQVPKNLEIPTGRRLQYNYSQDKKKKDKKGGRYLVTGLANLNRAPGYDTYIVSDKKKQCFIPRDAVRDNAFIDRCNGEISETAQALSDSLASCKNARETAYNDLLAAIEEGSQWSLGRVQGIRSNPDSILNVHVREVMDEDVLKYRTIRERYQEWVQTLPLDCRYAAGLLAVTGTSLTMGPSGACHFRLDFTNLSPKTIKTLSWRGKLLDAAGNELTCTARKLSVFTGLFKGPCPPAWPASCTWKDFATHPNAQRVALSQILIDYADGSRYEIEGDVLAQLLAMPSGALPAGVHTASHLEGLNQFEIDHNQLLQQKKKVFRNLLPQEEAIEKVNLGNWDTLKAEFSRRGPSDGGLQDILTDERFQTLFKKGPMKDAVRNYLETNRTLKGVTDRYARFRNENFYE